MLCSEWVSIKSNRLLLFVVLFALLLIFSYKIEAVPVYAIEPQVEGSIFSIKPVRRLNCVSPAPEHSEWDSIRLILLVRKCPFLPCYSEGCNPWLQRSGFPFLSGGIQGFGVNVEKGD
jgi:hypothetical protein